MTEWFYCFLSLYCNVPSRKIICWVFFIIIFSRNILYLLLFIYTKFVLTKATRHFELCCEFSLDIKTSHCTALFSLLHWEWGILKGWWFLRTQHTLHIAPPPLLFLTTKLPDPACFCQIGTAYIHLIGDSPILLLKCYLFIYFYLTTHLTQSVQSILKRSQYQCDCSSIIRLKAFSGPRAYCQDKLLPTLYFTYVMAMRGNSCWSFSAVGSWWQN